MEGFDNHEVVEIQMIRKFNAIAKNEYGSTGAYSHLKDSR
jgi:hypothetical protein